METTLGPINVTYLINNDDFTRNTNKVKTDIKGVTATATEEAAKMDQLYRNLGTAIAGYFSIQAAGGLVKDIALIRGEFQQLEISLQTILGSKEKADRLLAEVVQLAAKTPFSLQEVGQGTKQLLAYGFGAGQVTDTLRRLGDVAAGLSIPLGDLTYLYGTTRTQGRLFAKDFQQFLGRGIPITAELAKQFGVLESEVTDLVSAGKVGFKEVEMAINALTNEGGTFFNLMEKQSASITGKVSNLGDAFDRMYNSIGQSNEGVISDTLDTLILLVDNYQDVLDILEVLAITYGTYRAALILTSVASKTLAAANAGLTVTTILQQKWTLLAARAQAILNTTMLANPFVAAATALSAVVAALIVFNKNNEEAVEISEDFKNAVRDEIKASDDLFKALKKTNDGTAERAEAIEKINTTYKDYLPKQLTEVSNLEDIEKAQKAVNTAIGESIFLRSQEADLSRMREGTQAYADEFADAISDIIKDAGVSSAVGGQLSAEFEKALNELAEFSEQPIAQVQERLSKVLREFGVDFSIFGSGSDISSLNFQDLIKDTQAYAGALNREKVATDNLGEAKQAYLKQLGLVNEEQDNSTDVVEKEIIGLKKLKEELADLQLKRETIGETDTVNLAANEQAQIALQKRIAALEVQTLKQRESETKKTELQLLKEKLDEKKAAYQDYYTAIEVLGKETADVQFADLRKEADTYVDYLNKVKSGIDPSKSDAGRKQILVERELQVATGALSPLEVLKKEVEDMKQVYADFEDYKAKFGEQKAKEQFDKQLSQYESYLGFLKQKTLDNQGAFTGVMGNTATEGQREIVKFLNEETTEAVRKQEQSFLDLLAKYQDYNAERLRLEQNYQAERKALEDAGKFDELGELERKYQEEVDALNDANLERLDSYKELYAGTERLTTSAARRLIQIAKTLLSTQDMSAEKAKEIGEFIRSLEREINKLDLQDYARLGQALGNLGGALMQFGEDVGNSKIAGIGALFNGLASGVNNLLGAFEKDIRNIDRVVIGLNGFISIVEVLGSAARQRREAEEAYYASIIGFQQQYNLTLNEQLRLQSMLGESVFLTDYEGRIRDGLSALTDASKKYDEAISKLGEGRAIVGQRNAIDWGNVGKAAAGGAAIGSIIPGIGTGIGAAIGAIGGALAGIFGGKKKENVLIPLLEEYPELLKDTEDGVVKFDKALAQALITGNLVDEQTKDILQNIIEWEDAMEAAKQQITDVVSDLVGQLGGDVRNALVKAFEDGTDAAIAMGDEVEKVLEDIVAQLLFSSIFNEVFKELQNDLIAALASGDINETTKVFKDFFENAKDLSDTYYDQLAAAQAGADEAGFDIFKPDNAQDAQKGLTGSIERMSEQTGTELAGLFRGFYDVSKRNQVTGESILAIERQHYQATLEGLTYWAAIERNTAQTVDRLDDALVELKEIKNNTKGSPDGRDFGIDG